MQRVCSQTKRSFLATNGAAEFALNNFGHGLLAVDENANALADRASRNGNNTATGVSRAPCQGNHAGTWPQFAGFR
jgi:hypothetical protein